jgi:DNA ligase-1
VTQAIAQATGDPKLVAQPMMGYTQAGRAPQAQDFVALVRRRRARRATTAQSAIVLSRAPASAPLSAFLNCSRPIDDWVNGNSMAYASSFIRRSGGCGSRRRTCRRQLSELAALVDFLPDDIVLDSELIVVASLDAFAVDDLSDLRPFLNCSSVWGASFSRQNAA